MSYRRFRTIIHVPRGDGRDDEYIAFVKNWLELDHARQNTQNASKTTINGLLRASTPEHAVEIACVIVESAQARDIELTRMTVFYDDTIKLLRSKRLFHHWY